MNPILTICKPCFNKADVLIDDIKSYLALNDCRLYVKVNDNKSTDGTIELLSKISNPRFSFRVNNCNRGPGPNYMAALSGATSDYVIFLTDKDTVNLKVLPQFIDYLERERPNYGYVDLLCNETRPSKTYRAGVDSVLSFAYLSKHPSGYFWKTDLLEVELSQQYFRDLDPNFVFPFEIINGYIASKYAGTIVYYPLIITANKRGEQPRTASYNEENIYFGRKQLLSRFDKYMRSVIHTNLKLEDKRIVVKRLMNNFANGMTLTMRYLYNQEAVCYHYNLKRKIISFVEMRKNLEELLSYAKNIYCDDIVTKKEINRLRVKTYIKMLLVCLKDSIKEPIQRSL